MTDDPNRSQSEKFPQKREPLRRRPNPLQQYEPSLFGRANLERETHNFQRHKGFEVPKKKGLFYRFDLWVRRNPVTFQVVAISCAMSVFFSRLIYDVVIKRFIEPKKKIQFELMESVKKAQNRLRQYPKLLKSCASEAKRYARCVALKDNVLKGDCEQEFGAFKKCLTSSAKKSGIKL